MTTKDQDLIGLDQSDRRSQRDEGGGGGCESLDKIRSQNAANSDKEKRLHQFNPLTMGNELNQAAHFSDGDDEVEDSDDDDQYEQAMDIFVKHFDHHQRLGADNVDDDDDDDAYGATQTRQLRERRPSLPTESIELTTFSGVVTRRSQQFQMRLQQVRQQQQQQQLKANCKDASKQQLQHDPQNSLPVSKSTNNRPLSISSISSAASSGSSASSNSSSSSGIHSSLTRNSSLNYSQDFKRSNYSYSESAESLDASARQQQLSTIDDDGKSMTTGGFGAGEPNQTSATTSEIIENALRNLKLSGKDNNLAQTRAAILAASELQRQQFSATRKANNLSSTSGLTGEGKLSRINRTFHASLRYDKSTAYRIHLMANARGFGLGGQAKSYNLNGATGDSGSSGLYSGLGRGSLASESSRGIFRRYSTVSRNDSSTSSDTGYGAGGSSRQCYCNARRKQSIGDYTKQQQQQQQQPIQTQDQPSSTSSSFSLPSANSNQLSIDNDDNNEDSATARKFLTNKAATLDGTTCQRTSPVHHHPYCPSYVPTATTTTTTFAPSPSSNRNGGTTNNHQHFHHLAGRPLRASSKLHQSPSSVSSYSNTSSLFRDDGFEDDLNSTTSEHSSSITRSSSGIDSNCSQIKLNYQRLQSAPAKRQQQNQHQQLVPLAPQLHHQGAQIVKGPLQVVNSANQTYHRHRIHNEQELPLLSISQRVVTEIIETERSYVDDLEEIVSGYLCRLRDVLDQHQELFSNLEEVHKFNKNFLLQLEECYLNPGSIAACFVENGSKFDVYTHYCTMYPQVVSTLTELMAQPASAQLLKERQLELNQSLPLGAYLLKPVQRILKYHILFKSLIKHTADDETVNEKDRELIGEAFSVMTNIACHINEMKKRHEHSIRVQELQSLLCGWEGPDLTTLGELILEDTFKLFNRQKSSRHLLLFDNVLLITKKKRDGSLHYKNHIECSNLMLIETIEGQPLVFNTVPFDNPKALSAFQADNLDRKRDWCLQMKEVIIKSFEVKIPHHVRDLLMSLTKTSPIPGASETGGSKKALSADKSSSGRVLRAPNYLERKRSKQQLHDKSSSSNNKAKQ